MNLRKNNCYVITGGPGVGKTKLLNELAKHGFKVVPEDAREIIKKETENGGDGLPWKNKERYTYLMLEKAFENYKSVSYDEIEPYFFDRGILDAICYAGMIELTIPCDIEKIVRNSLYNKKVFMLPPWKEIYHTDSERKQDWEEAILTFEKMKETYINYGYEIIEVPKDIVENRATFVLNNINSSR
ncbi:AAA family ATPase [Polluticaenibacter yanchengensis]|uniref:AAA family ATPase n=1 Tax=Polluticaenibacter yanchengensis TaxID=3014562 RepID=A0ABT4UP27_9BACT|nr:AAA family ATPase [Chitinophagaceae bacterium LY-5]